MEIFEFVRGSLIWMATIALLWPLNAPMMGLAMKVLFGQRPIDMEEFEYWTRSTLAAFGVAITTLVMIGIDYFLAFSAEMPEGVVHMVLLPAYFAAAAYVIFVVFNLEDYFQALGGMLLYVFLPIAVLYIVNAMFGWWQPMLNLIGSWLKEVSP